MDWVKIEIKLFRYIRKYSFLINGSNDDRTIQLKLGNIFRRSFFWNIWSFVSARVILHILWIKSSFQWHFKWFPNAFSRWSIIFDTKRFRPICSKNTSTNNESSGSVHLWKLWYRRGWAFYSSLYKMLFPLNMSTVSNCSINKSVDFYIFTPSI